MEIGSVPGKMDEYFHWGLIFYAILQGIGSHSCIRVYIIYVIPFGEQEPWMSEVPKTFQQKKQVPRNDQFLFILYLKNEGSEAHRRGPPTTGVVEL